MARPYRLQAENCFYHITSRGNGKKAIYINDSDHCKFLDYLRKAKEKFEFYLYAYVLMPNHYHLLIETLKSNLSRIMHYINGSYTCYFNTKWEQCGHLFQGRYKSLLVDEDGYFLRLTRYIHLNPVRGKIVERPEDYPWSSYNGYINRKNDNYIDKEVINQALDMNPQQYRQFVYDGIGKKDDIFKDVYAGFILGDPQFVESQLKLVEQRAAQKDVSFKKKLSQEINREEIIELISKVYDIESRELCKKKKSPLLEKKIAIYLMKRLTQLTNEEIGTTFAISYSAVSKITAGIEKAVQEDRGLKLKVEELISHFKG